MPSLEGGSDALNMGKRKADSVFNSDKKLVLSEELPNKKSKYGLNYLHSLNIMDVEVTSMEGLTTPTPIGSTTANWHADRTQ